MTGDLISRDDALSALKGVIARTGLYGTSIEVILANVPAVEAEPVVHAHWELRDLCGDGCSLIPSCSNCGEHDGAGYERCPHCGAHMDEEVTENEEPR